MKTTLNKTELAGALAALGKLVCRSSPIPVYRAVQIEATNNILFFRTHNADEEIEFRMDAETEETFKVAVDFDFFRSLVRNSRNKNIKFDFADGALRLDDVLVVPIEGEWPVTEVPQGDSVATSPLPENFVEILSAAAPLVDLNEAKKVLRGMSLSKDGITATNGKELFNFPYPFNLDELTIPFPLALMATKAAGAGEVKAWSNDFFTFFSVRIGKWIWSGKAILGAYPNWKRVMPDGKAMKHRVSFTTDCAERMKFFLKGLPDSGNLNRNGTELFRNNIGELALHHASGLSFSVPAEFDPNWDKLNVRIRKEILQHMLNEGHTKIEFIDALCPFIASGGIGQYVAMPMCMKPQAEAEQPAPEPPEQESVNIPTITNTTTSNQEKSPMIDTNTITHVVSAPAQTFTPNNKTGIKLNPMDELTVSIEAFKTKLKAMVDESTAMSRKVCEVAISQRQKEREYARTKKTIEKIRVASGF